MNTTRVRGRWWVLAVVLAHAAWADERDAAAALRIAQASPSTRPAPAQSAQPAPNAQAAPGAQASQGTQAPAPLPLTCEAPVTKESGLALRIQLTEDAFKTVVFDHPKPEGLPTGVIGQTKICTCVDNNGNLKDPVKLVRASGSPQLDAEATEIGKTISYPAGHPGCMHQTVNFAAP